MTNEEAAYAAEQWAYGLSQPQIAAALGRNSPTAVCIAIDQFIRRYVPEAEVYKDGYGPIRLEAHGEERRALAATAVVRFRKEGGAVPDIRAEPIPDIPVEPMPAGDLLDLPVGRLGPMSTRLHHSLTQNANCQTVRDVVAFSEQQLMRTPNLGRVSLVELKRLLAHHGLRLAGAPHYNPLPPVPISPTFPSVHERLTRIEATLEEVLAAVEKLGRVSRGPANEAARANGPDGG
jgi:hypothetical protein